MNIIKTFSIFYVLTVMNLCGVGEPVKPTASSTVNRVQKQFDGKVATVSNLTINVNCSPQQIIKDVKQDLYFMLGRLPELSLEKVRTVSNLCGNTLYDYRYKLGGVAVGSMYFLLLYQVIQGNSFLENSESWYCWKKGLPLQQFLEISQDELSRELILEIQRRYTDVDKPTDFITSLIAFMHDIDYEIASVKYYIKLESWLRTLRVSIVLPINRKRYSKASELLNRLTFIRSVFLNWAAHYKMDMNHRCVIGLS